jgi:hypothetical protein
MTTRDPRRDPRPGDVVRFPEADRRVVSVKDGEVAYEFCGGSTLSLEAWRSTLERSGTVIHAAPEADQ